ncbi:MAG: hypothetical protein SGJ11_16240 [Phycisphaerae bacterium]|nr:hypothetical protein [Phycisphaerae bacterium]
MGQFTLGLRSLLIKAAIFVLLAALLAWLLGGTLFPRAVTSDGPAVAWNGAKWHLRASLGGDQPGVLRWSLMRQRDSETAQAWPDDRPLDRFAEAAGPLATEGALYVAFRSRDATEWTLFTIRDAGFESTVLPDRLEVERQLNRVRNGLPLQAPDARP